MVGLFLQLALITSGVISFFICLKHGEFMDPFYYKILVLIFAICGWLSIIMLPDVFIYWGRIE